MSKRINIYLRATLLIYVFSLLRLTVFGRVPGFYTLQLEPFWSYRRLTLGDVEIGREILANIIAFIPIGFLIGSLFSDKRDSFCFAIILGALFSLTIELLQFILMRGTPETDDIINNSLGSIMGWAIFRIIRCRFPRKYNIESLAFLGMCFTGSCLAICLSWNNYDAHIATRYYCIQVDRVAFEKDNVALLQGFAFWCEDYHKEPELILKSTATNRRIPLEIEYGIVREDVKNYFGDIDCLKSGFIAKGNGVSVDEEYEVLIRINRFAILTTGIYITGTNVHYASQKTFQEPDVVGTDLEFILAGNLRASNPNKTCLVYQYNNSLFWIADENYSFEDDGLTYIQYQLWTTEPDKLPSDRIKNGLSWDNIGGYFEEYEITDEFNCGRYRVMKRDLPTEYPIISIVTGYYKNDKWLWQDYFRPVYNFN